PSVFLVRAARARPSLGRSPGARYKATVRDPDGVPTGAGHGHAAVRATDGRRGGRHVLRVLLGGAERGLRHRIEQPLIVLGQAAAELVQLREKALQLLLGGQFGLGHALYLLLFLRAPAPYACESPPSQLDSTLAPGLRHPSFDGFTEGG